MYERILVPTDGSDAATVAGEVGVVLAREFGADLHALSVQEVERWPFRLTDELSAELLQRGQNAVADVSDRAAADGVDATTAVVGEGGSVHETVLGYANEHGVDCIVMGTHGRTGVGRLLIGSVTEQVLRESPVPVVTVREETTVEWPPDSILVPTDGSDAAGVALATAIELAERTDASLHLVHAVDIGLVTGDVDGGMVLEALEQAGERAVEIAIDRVKKSDVTTVESSIVSGPPSRAICEYAEERGVDWIVMGTHGRTGVERVLLGSVAERVIRRSTAPVIATKAPRDGE